MCNTAGKQLKAERWNDASSREQSKHFAERKRCARYAEIRCEKQISLEFVRKKAKVFLRRLEIESI